MFESTAWPQVLAWLATLPELTQLRQIRREHRPDTSERSLFLSPPRPRSGGPLVKQVAAEREPWRAAVTQQAHQEREISRGGDDIETLVELFLALLDTSLTKRQVYCRYIRRRFHFDVVLERWLSSVPQRVATSAESQTLRGATQAFFYHASVIWVGLRAVVQGQAAGLDAPIILANAVLWMHRAIREIPPQLVGALTESAHNAVQVAATMQLAGWAATQLSLRNPRLQAMLEAKDKHAITTLLTLLPARVLLAWKERHPLEPLLMLEKRIRRYVLEDTVQAPSRNTRRLGFDDEPSLETMWVREEMRRAINLDALTAHAELAPREAAIWDMVRQGLPCTEIAARLKIAEGTVKAAMFRIREKLRKAANT